MKYSVNPMNISRKTNKLNSISYSCYDSNCNGRGHANIIYTKINEKEIIEIKDFKVTREHSISIPYEEHIYVIYDEVENDIKNKKINRKKLNNICYTRAYFMKEIKNSP